MIAKTKLWRKSRIMFHGYRQLDNLHKKEDIYIDIAKDVKTSNYELEKPLPRGKNKKVIGLMKDEFVGKIITEFASLIPKT